MQYVTRTMALVCLAIVASCGGRVSDVDAPTEVTATAITSQPGFLVGVAAGQYFAASARVASAGGDNSQVSSAYSVGSEKNGELGNGVDSASGAIANPVLTWQFGPAPCDFSSNSHCIRAVAAGNCHMLWLMNSGVIYGMGCNGQGQLGIPGDFTDKAVPTALPTGNVVAIAAGGNSSYCATNPAAFGASGSPAIYATGQNDHGQLGIGNFANANVWTPLTFTAGSPHFPPKQIAASGQHAVLLDGINQVFAWGRNDKAQVIAQPLADQSLPQFLFSGACSGAVGGGHDYVAASTMSSYWAGYRVNGSSCADVEVLSWGDNTQGQLGVGSVDTSPHPLDLSRPSLHINTVNGNVYLGLAAGPYSAYAMYGDNWTAPGVQGDQLAHMYVTGANSSGQLGMGNTSALSSWTTASGTNYGLASNSYLLVAGYDAAYESDLSSTAPQKVLVTGGDADGQLAVGAFVPSTLFTPSEL